MGSEEKWVEFRYENFPYVCYYCGILGYTKKSCIIREEDVRNSNIKRDQFDIWMRAENHGFAGNNPRRQSNQNVNSHGLTISKSKQIVDCVEGTGSNELPMNNNGGAKKRDTENKNYHPSFAPH